MYTPVDEISALCLDSDADALAALSNKLAAKARTQPTAYHRNAYSDLSRAANYFAAAVRARLGGEIQRALDCEATAERYLTNGAVPLGF